MRNVIPIKFYRCISVLKLWLLKSDFGVFCVTRDLKQDCLADETMDLCLSCFHVCFLQSEQSLRVQLFHISLFPLQRACAN